MTSRKDTDRSVVDRIFNDPVPKENERIIDQLDESTNGLSQNHLIFSKLLEAANGTVTLSPEDADQIISVICKNMKSGGMFRMREETTAAIVDLLGSTAENCDNALLTYLTTNYSRSVHENDRQEIDDPPITPSSASKRRTSVDNHVSCLPIAN